MNTKKKINRSFIEQNNVKYFAVDYLAALHNVSSETIRSRINKHKIIGIVMLNELWFPDDVRYDRRDPSLVQKETIKKSTISNYAAMYHLIKQIDAKLDLLLDHLTSSKTTVSHFINENGSEHNDKDKT